MMFYNLNTCVLQFFIFIFLITPFLPLGNLNSVSHAQVATAITSDIKLEKPTRVIPGADGKTYNILDGTLKGSNLFHSFDQFSVGEGDIARFHDTRSGIANILSRVTGGDKSKIFGTLSSTIQGANLYLFNPAGVAFGPDAKLDVKGSFHLSTADYLRLDDGKRFNAIPGPQDKLLTSAPVTAFGFLSGNPEAITVQGSFLEVPNGETISMIGGKMEIKPGVAGDGELKNGYLYAPEGQISVVSVASVGEVGVGGGAPVVNNLEHLGEINITHSFERKEIGDHKVGNLDVSGNGGGTVYIRGGKFVMEGGQVSSETSGDKSAGGIDIRLSGDFVGKDQSKILSETSGSGDTGNIYIEAENITLETDSEICNAATRFESSGKLGDIAIRADGLVTISGDSVVEIDNRGSGKVGDITIKADKLVTISDDSVVEIDNRSSGTGGNIVAVGGDLTLATGGEIRTSARSRINDSGNASNITITAGSVSMSDFSRIENFFFSRGEAGAITLNVDNLTMTRNSEILSDVFAFSGATKAGDITITTEGSVIMSENSFILSRIDSNELPGFGVGGNITIGAEKKVHLFQNSIISVDAFDAARAGNVSIRAGNSCLFENSSLTTNAESASETITAGNIRVETNSLSLVGSKSKISSSIEGIGEAGSIELVDVEKLALLRGAVINTDSIGNGKAGDITVVSKDISIAGSGSAISSSAEGKGDSGAIVLNNAETLMVLEGGIITTDSKGAGKAGGITVASNKILLSGSASAISSSTEGSGNSGSIELNTLGSVILSEGGVISTNSTGEGRGGDIIVTSGNVSLSGSDSAISSTSEGIKDAGSITINADNLLMNGNSAITTDAKRANGGSINLTFHSLMHLVDSEITSSVKGGTSTEGGKISMNLNRGVLESSQIRATAIEGKGGNIDIRAEVFLADPNSVVSASSEKGIDGEVDIRAPITNISGNIVPLKSNFSSATSLLLQPCAVKMSGGKRSSLVIVSRDGLPMQPGDLLPSPLYDEAMAAVDAEMASMNVGPTLVYGANTIQKKGLLPLELLGDESGCATCP